MPRMKAQLWTSGCHLIGCVDDLSGGPRQCVRHRGAAEGYKARSARQSGIDDGGGERAKEKGSKRLPAVGKFLAAGLTVYI